MPKQIWPPAVPAVARYAAWNSVEKRWTGHATLNAAAQTIRRVGSTANCVWMRDGEGWSEVAAPRRPYGARSGVSLQTRIVVTMRPSLLRELDRRRGATPRTAFLRTCVGAYFWILDGCPEVPIKVVGRWVSCRSAHDVPEVGPVCANWQLQQRKVCACSDSGPGCTIAS